MAKKPNLSTGDILSRIVTVRQKRVILASDLANLFGVETKRLNEQVRRNMDRFPSDFVFQLTRAEQVGLSRSQSATLKKGRNLKYRPYAFTEHGAIMAANVLNSPRAVAMSVFVVRAFIQQRDVLAVNAGILKRIAEIDKELLLHDSALRDIYHRLQPLLQPPPVPPKPPTGFRETSPRYGTRRPARLLS